MKPLSRKNLYALAIVAGLTFGFAPGAWAHCDAMDGPVIGEAQAALSKGDVTPLLKWVPAKDESKIRAAFDNAMQARGLNKKAQEQADHRLFATLVKVHRASEGASFTGIKPAGHIDPAVSAADAALAEGDIDELVAEITQRVEQGVRQRFAAARATKQLADRSVPEGRAYVNAYVQYVHYVEGLHNAAAATAHDEHKAERTAKAHDH